MTIMKELARLSKKPQSSQKLTVRMANAMEQLVDELEQTKSNITSLNDTVIAENCVIEVLGTPIYVEDITSAAYLPYQLTETGWYVFCRVTSEDDSVVTANMSIEGADGYVADVGEDHVDIAVRFDVAAMTKKVIVHWTGYDDTFVFRATDLAIRNLDYRTTFYVYDAAPYATWTYGLTADTTFAENKKYYTLANDEYTLAEVTAGEAVPADTYYEHTKITFSGMARNITYRFDEIIDCPSEFILPEIEDETHGCWFEIRCQHAGEYSMTLVPPSADVKIATEHTQKETAGLNMIDLHYTYINGIKLWRFLNTHSSIPT